jgi:Ulp1 family protease
VTLSQYLSAEWAARHNSQRNFNASLLPGYRSIVPLQNNDCDCGVFLLQYVYLFMKEPFKNSSAVHRPGNSQSVLAVVDLFADWFPIADIATKRDEIRALILSLRCEWDAMHKIPRKNSSTSPGFDGRPLFSNICVGRTGYR